MASKACALVIVCLALSIGCGSSKKSTTGWRPPTGTGCAITPRLTVPWQIVDSVTDLPITCAYAGAFDVDLDVSEAVAGTELFTQPCAANASSGQFVVDLIPGPGSYAVDVFLIGETGGVLSELASPAFAVACGDFTTPVVVLPVNL